MRTTNEAVKETWSAHYGPDAWEAAEAEAIARRRVRRSFFHVKMLVLVLVAFVVISAAAMYGNELVDLVLEPPCPDTNWLDRCELRVR